MLWLIFQRLQKKLPLREVSSGGVPHERWRGFGVLSSHFPGEQCGSGKESPKLFEDIFSYDSWGLVQSLLELKWLWKWRSVITGLVDMMLQEPTRVLGTCQLCGGPWIQRLVRKGTSPSRRRPQDAEGCLSSCLNPTLSRIHSEYFFSYILISWHIIKNFWSFVMRVQ